MRKILFTLMCLASAVAVSATVYKWVDENGVIHYSDQPHENAEKVSVRAPQTYSASQYTQNSNPKRGSNSSGSSSAAAPQSSGSTYRCTISQPANDETLMNASSVPVSVQLEPGPRPGDQVFVLLDGQRVPGLPTGGGQFTLPSVDRGSHSLQALVQDSSGRLVCQSPSVTFNVHQPSVLNPQSPVHPK